jgi:hypothetical protein
MNISLTAQCLTHVNKNTEITCNDLVKAYEQADLFTSLGFEVTTPKSLDDETYTITIAQ